MDILDCSTAEKSKSGVDMPLFKPGTEDVLTHQDKDDKEPREMYLRLLGPESQKTRRALLQMQHRASKKDKKGNHSPSDEELDNEARSDSKVLAELTVGGLVFMKGKWVDVTSENAAEIYNAVMPFRSQAIKFALDVGNFTRG